MRARQWSRWCCAALAAMLFSAVGCGQMGSGRSGVYVLFEGRPNIYHEAVFFNGQVVGKIIASEHKGSSITRLTIAIAPEYKKRIDSNWALYANSGRISAVRLQGGGKPLAAGGKLCGFSSKGAYQWFKISTLLSDRAYKASKRAEYLSKRFEFS